MRADQAWISAVECAGVAVLDGRRLGLDFDLYDAEELRAARDPRQSFAVCNVPYWSFGPASACSRMIDSHQVRGEC